MQLTILQKKENPLLERFEVSARIIFEGVTPSNVQVTEQLARQFGCPAEVVVVRHIYTGFGHQEGTVDAFVYASREVRQKVETVYSHLKKKSKEGEAVKEKPQKKGKGK